MMSFFENRYRQISPDFTAEVTVRPALRVNTLKIDPRVLVKRLEAKGVTLEKIPWLAYGYWYEADFSLGATPEYLLGYYYLQGAASQLVAEAVAPAPGATVLDMAAAPGSKTTHLAQLMENKGVIVALDSNVQRLAALRNNCERLMVQNVLMVKKDARFISDLGMTFDKILLDAPCSVCSEPGWFGKRRIGEIQQNARVQKELLKAAYRVLRPGGTLVYSTCSLEPEEDELVIGWFLRKHDDLRLVPPPGGVGDEGLLAWEGKALHPALTTTRRCWPHKTGTEGFFIAKLRKE